MSCSVPNLDVIRALIKEKRELKSKCVKLNMFFLTDEFKGCSCLQQKLMYSQFTAMQTYLGILDLRIKDIKGDFDV